VVGSISADELKKAVNVLEPDEIADAGAFGISPSIGVRHGSPVLAVWWD
jgi:hypothetical protein